MQNSIINHLVSATKSNSYFLLILSGLVIFNSNFCHAGTTIAGPEGSKCTIVVDYSGYKSAEDAAESEESVNWYDENYLDDTRCTEAFAAVELRIYLCKIAGLRYDNSDCFPIVGPKDDVKGNKIIIGDVKYPGALKPYMKQLPQAGSELYPPEQGFVIKTIKGNESTIILLCGGDRTGALYAAYDFLEMLGVRWYGLGEKDEEVPKSNPLKISNIDKTEKPAFLTRGFWVDDDRGNPDFFDWLGHNRLNLWSYGQPERAALKKRGIKVLAGDHKTQERFLNPDHEYPYNHPKFKSDEQKKNDPYKLSPEYSGDINRDGKISYGEAHPEWYGQINCIRVPEAKHYRGVNFCTNNRDAVRELSKNLIIYLVEGEWSEVDIIHFWLSDLGKWCECPECLAFGTPTDRILKLLHEVRKEIKKTMEKGRLKRNVQIFSLAYIETLPPPTKSLPAGFDYDNIFITFFPIQRCYVHAFNDFKCTECNKYIRQNYEKWTLDPERFFRGTIVMGEYYYVSHLGTLPMVYTRIMANDIPYFYETGTRHMHYMHIESNPWGTMVLTNYQFAKMLWNPEVDVNRTFDELYNDFYGPKAAELMREFYDCLEPAMASMKTIKNVTLGPKRGKKVYWYRIDRRIRSDEPDLFPYDHLKYEPHKSPVNDGKDIVEMVRDIQNCRYFIDKILMIDMDDKYRRRIQEVEARFAYGETTVMFFYHIIRTHMAHQAKTPDIAEKEFQKATYYVDKLKQITGMCFYLENGYSQKEVSFSYEHYEKIYGKNPK